MLWVKSKKCKLLKASISSSIGPLSEDGGLNNPALPFRPCSPEEIQEALLIKEAKARDAKEAKRASADEGRNSFFFWVVATQKICFFNFQPVLTWGFMMIPI